MEPTLENIIQTIVKSTLKEFFIENPLIFRPGREEILTKSQLATKLDCTTKHIDKLVKDGYLKKHTLGSKQYFFLSEVMEELKKQ